MAGAKRDWSERVDAGITWLRCEALRSPHWRHGFSTRSADGRDDFDLGSGDSSDVPHRRRRFLEAVGLTGSRPVTVRQVHGARVEAVSRVSDRSEADGLLWLEGRDGELAPCVRTADCVPILLQDRRGRGAAAVHAGWRGTAAGIASRAVRELASVGVPARDVSVAIGPAIGGCCYEVGEEVVSAIASACGGTDGWSLAAHPARVDLAEANRAQLIAAGVPAEAIHACRRCTACDPSVFFSYRRDGVGCGRMMACIGRVHSSR